MERRSCRLARSAPCPGAIADRVQIFYVMQMFYIFILFVKAPTNLPTLTRVSPSILTCSISAKASICCFCARVFTNNRRVRFVTMGFMTILLTHGLMFLFLVAFQCLPVQSIWDRSMEGRCLDLNALGYAGASVNILEDVLLFVMPVPELMKLQLSTKKRLALVFMFSVASL